MIIEQITIENFRSYFGKQTLNLARGLKGDRNVVAIGGLNGAGKTTLHDAITVGLLGHVDAFKFVKGLDRKRDERRTIDRDLNALINREALAAGEREAKVTLFLLDDDGTKFAVQRAWQYDARGSFKHEELVVTRPDVDLLAGGTWEDSPEDRFSDYMKNHVLPPAVSRFFLFDGEEIREIAQNEPDAAVREGIDSLLSFHLADALIGDMDNRVDHYRTEARKRNRQEEDLDKLRVDEKKLDNQRREIEEEKIDLEGRAEDLRAESRRLLDDLKSTVGASGKDPRVLDEELIEVNRGIQRTRDQLQAAVDQRIVLALPGQLVRSLVRQLDAEDARAQWEEGKEKVKPQRERLIARLFGDAAPDAEPPLVPAQRDFLCGRMRKEWDDLFNPPPAGIAREIRHGYLAPEERNQVRGKCTDILRSGLLDLKRLLGDLDELERRGRDIRGRLERISDREAAARLLTEKAKADRALGEVEAQREAKDRELTSVQTNLKQKRKEISDKVDELAKSGESTSKADFARRVRRAIELYKELLRPRKRDELAKHLCEMYRHLARKEDLVQKIELDERTYSPRLLDRSGNLIPLDSQSAGEREIYALSLLWALGKTSRRELPVVIDTPLARLDSAHRSNIVKRYLPQAGRQVIVLSTDTEIDRQYFDLIQSHIACSLRLDFDPATQRTTVRDGYFDFH